MRLYSYIREEVSRQGHDVTIPDGQIRIAWMWEAWEYASVNWPRDHSLAVRDIENLGQLVEPNRNLCGFTGWESVRAR